MTETKCGIKHGFGDQVCNREAGHDGLCRCKTERMADGSLTYSEWASRDGKFHRHSGYTSIYPKNSRKVLSK